MNAPTKALKAALDDHRLWLAKTDTDAKRFCFSGGSFSDVDFTGVNLSSANLSNTIYRFSSFVNADLSNADCCRDGVADFHGSDFTGANLSGIKAARASFRFCIFNKTDFTNANLKDADFTGAKFVDSDDSKDDDDDSFV